MNSAEADCFSIFEFCFVNVEVGTCRSDTNGIISLPLKLQAMFYNKCVYPSEMSS